jgi:hypothetical protein
MPLISEDEDPDPEPYGGGFVAVLLAVTFMGVVGWGLWALAWRALGVWG